MNRRTGTFRLEGVVTFLPEKFTEFLNGRLLKSGDKRTQIARKTNSSQFTVWQEIFRGIISLILDFSGFARKKLANLDFGLYSWE